MSIIERAASRLKTHASQRPAGASEILSPAEQAAQADAQAAAAATTPVSSEAAAPVVPTAPAPAAAPAASAATAAPGAPASTPAAPAASTATPAAPAAAEPAPARSTPAKRIDINLERLAGMGFLTPGSRSLISEQFRMIKRSLLRQAFAPREAGSNPGNLIMVTSSLPNEGKTFCSINLALSIAMELDHTVLLVDADVARPSVLRTFDVAEEGAGMMNLLLDDKVDMADVLLKTNVDTLSVLPVGPRHSHSSELLASQSMHLLLEEIASRYPDRIVIFDSPPLLVTSEANVLATKMGQIAMVVAAESTSQQAVKTSLNQLKGCQNVSLIYNKSMAFAGSPEYGYGYGYGY
ncbi:XrtA-associated tyrosine autokinase [Herbaspirillum sp. NPDC087042]|uniref:XrtA-associated tyrosine autokinase n=1 Tax=Herbaspirillum sp. NPDC087042 TaxID=3364004 RepID=UPI0037F3AABA